jgi:hypothetical protein
MFGAMTSLYLTVENEIWLICIDCPDLHLVTSPCPFHSNQMPSLELETLRLEYPCFIHTHFKLLLIFSFYLYEIHTHFKLLLIFSFHLMYKLID